MSNYIAIRELMKKISGQDNTITIPKLYIELTGDLTTALVLNQIVFWSDKSKRADGFFYKSYKEWQEEVFLSERQVRYAVKKLKDNDFVSTKLKKANGAPTLHYKLEFDNLLDSILTICQNPLLQNVSMENDKMSDSLDADKMSETLTDEYNSRLQQKNTTDKKDNVALAPSLPFSDIVDYLNEKAGTNFKSTTQKTQSLIKARFKEGFTLNDFKKVIDIKTAEWLNNKEMNRYLRPETLFGPKFESYLNQKAVKGNGANANAQQLAQDYDLPF
ncbi:conserved phage C-terminal domain-containing protein [Pseudobacillus sp. FSL P4-0506]|uniref:conserved phage C-terminal domain-containing protein n=1 Tax=Pseudobacillus sp. FSL P4-0506 TaxID=2921576 RepID=UPI0030F5A438